MTRRSLARLVPLGAACGAALAAGCRSEQVQAAAAAATLPDSAEQVMYKMRHNVTNAGVRRAYLVGDTAYIYDDGNRIELRTVRMVFFAASGDSSSVLTGRRGRIDVRQKRVEGRGNVVVTSTDGKRLASQHLTYDQFTNQITSDSAFTFNEPGRSLSGVGLRTDPQLRNVQVLRGLGGRTQVNADAMSRPGALSPGAVPPPPVTPPTGTPTPAAPPASPPPSSPPAEPDPGGRLR